MTRKDYQLIAEILRTAQTRIRIGALNTPAATLEYIAVELADMLHADNPRFGRERFFAACEPKDR